MSLKSPFYLLFSLFAALSFSTGINAQAGRAQTTTPDPLSDVQTQDGGSGIFSERGGTSQFFDLMHSLQRGEHLRNAEQLNSDRQENIENAAAEFRRRQLELLNSSPSAGEPTTETTE